MEHLSQTQFNQLNEKQQREAQYHLALETNIMVKKHDLVIGRILAYENVGRLTGRLLLKVFIAAIIGGATGLAAYYTSFFHHIK